MQVSLNGRGTAFYYPRAAVFEFLRIKERQNKPPFDEIYKDRDFIKKFFKQRMALFSTLVFVKKHDCTIVNVQLT